MKRLLQGLGVALLFVLVVASGLLLVFGGAYMLAQITLGGL